MRVFQPGVQILDYVGAPIVSVNVLEDPEIRQGVKEYANWPTIPQLYVKGEFVGGCDIVREMFQSGELASVLTDAGVQLKSRPGPERASATSRRARVRVGATLTSRSARRGLSVGGAKAHARRRCSRYSGRRRRRIGACRLILKA